MARLPGSREGGRSRRSWRQSSVVALSRSRSSHSLSAQRPSSTARAIPSSISKPARRPHRPPKASSPRSRPRPARSPTRRRPDLDSAQAAVGPGAGAWTASDKIKQASQLLAKRVRELQQVRPSPPALPRAGVRSSSGSWRGSAGLARGTCTAGMPTRGRASLPRAAQADPAPTLSHRPIVRETSPLTLLPRAFARPQPLNPSYKMAPTSSRSCKTRSRSRRR